MNKVKITVIETALRNDLIEKYGCPSLSSCPFHKMGETFITSFQKPDNLCADAWCCIEKYVFTLSHTEEPLFWNDWAQLGTAVACCNDGFRPVTFHIQRLPEKA